MTNYQAQTGKARRYPKPGNTTYSGGIMILFPENFIWGAATASYQIEGAANEDGRSPSIWDVFSHIKGNIENDDNGDVACDHYHRYKDDVNLMKNIGLNAYRFSLSWSRLLPGGNGKPNQKGADFYNGLIDELLRHGIDPMITLYHWDLPQVLQDKGGWGNRDIAGYFEDYSECAFRFFGDRVKKWVTHNEPWVVAYAGHHSGRHAPGMKDLHLAVRVSHHLILSHARSVSVFRDMNFKDSKIGITLNLYPSYPLSDGKNDVNAAKVLDEYHNKWFLDPVLKGEYPAMLLQLFGDNGLCPDIAADDMDIIGKNICDFIGVNYYFRKIARYSGDGMMKYEEIKPPESEYTSMNWEIYPEGLYDLLMQIKKDYGNPELYITENGACFEDSLRNDIVADDRRTAYLKAHLEQSHRAIKDGVNLKGYYLWSLMDNFEWAFGYGKRFGITYVDYRTQRRILKNSGLWYKKIIGNNGF
jgi:beta-glucosidase